jgi:hypothetical protein
LMNVFLAEEDNKTPDPDPDDGAEDA